MVACNAPTTLIGYPPNHGRCAWDVDCPHIPTLVFYAHFVLTRAHPGLTSRSVTHPKTTPSKARLTLDFFPDGLPEKKVHLVDMSSLSFLLRSWAVTLGKVDEGGLRLVLGLEEEHPRVS